MNEAQLALSLLNIAAQLLPALESIRAAQGDAAALAAKYEEERAGSNAIADALRQP